MEDPCFRMDTLKQIALLYLRLKVFHFCKIFRHKCPCFNGPFRYPMLIPLPSYSARATFCLADLARKLIFTVCQQETEIFEWGYGVAARGPGDGADPFFSP